jgi:Zinc-binding dehydrogenase
MASGGLAGAGSEPDGDLQCVTGPFLGDAEGPADFLDRQHVAEQRGYVDRGAGRRGRFHRHSRRRHVEVPIANVYPLAQVGEAYTQLERRHTRGKIILRP